MTTCPNCGKMAGLHSSILQGCMCQYSMQAMKEGKDFTVSKQWVGLTEQERNDLEDYCEMIIGKAAFDAIEAKLKEKNTK